MITYLLFVAGIILLLKSAEYLVDSSSSLAKKMGVSTLVIGLTVVAFGTSLPELMVNVFAALEGRGDIAFGNVIGSSISNLFLVLGLAAILFSIKVKRSTVRKEIPFSLLAVVVIIVFSSTLFLDGISPSYILRSQGVILLLFFLIFLYYVYELAKKDKKQFSKESLDIKELSHYKIFSMVVLGIIGLYLGGKWTVDGAVAIARLLGVSEYFISLTVISIGTSLPEIVTSIVAAIKKNADLAVGNIVGSNIFNLFWVLGISAIISPIKIPHFAIIDLAILFFASSLLFLFMFVGKKHEIDKWQGTSFVLMYVLYIIHLVLRV